jgi:hypothetical protein
MIGAPTGTGAPSGAGAPNGAGAPTGGATGTGGASGGASGGGAAAGTGPGKAIGMPAMSESGAPAGLHMAATGVAPTSPAVVCMHAEPPVISGAAATSGLSATATPHNPAATATTLMLNRSKTVIDVDSFIRAQTPKSRLDDRVNYQQRTSHTRPAAPRRFQMVTFGMVWRWCPRKRLIHGGPRAAPSDQTERE